MKIPVVEMKFWDGANFILRTDKAGWKELMDTTLKEKGRKFLLLNGDEQIAVYNAATTALGGLVNLKETRMEEEEYLKIRKGL